MRRSLCLLSLFLVASLAKASTYYVTPNGASNREGSSAADALSVADFNKSHKPGGGDTVVFSGTFTSPVTPASNGSTGNPLTLDLREATLNAGFTLSGRSNISVLGGTISPTATGTITLNNASNITEDGWIYDGPTNGTASFAYLNGCTNIIISNCRVTNCAYGFVGDKNRFITITGCDVTSSTNTTAQTDIVHFGSASDVIIEKNKLVLRAPGNASVRHNDVIQTYRSGASGGFDSQNWVIRYNWIENQCVQPSSDGNASWTMLEALVGTPAIKIYDNVFNAPSTSGGGGANNGIRDNKNPNGSATHYLYNNTIIKRANPGNVIYYLAPGTAIWKNNILWSPAGQNSGNPNSTMTTTADYNFFYRNGTNFTGPHGSGTVDPMLKNPDNNDYSLAAGSPCIGSADNTIGAEYAFGLAPGSTFPNPTVVARTGRWDVGAYVYNASAGGPTPTPTPTPNPTPTPGPKFKVGDTVSPTKLVNIRDRAAGTVIGTHDVGDIGTVNDGPVVADLNGAPVNWYDITWETDPTDGWVGDDNLQVTDKPPKPTPTPSPSATPTPTPTPGPSPTPSPGNPTYERWIEQQNNWIRQNPPTPD